MIDLMKAALEIDDHVDAATFTEPADPLGEWLERRAAPPAKLTESQEKEIIDRCEKRMVAFLSDLEIQRRLIRDLPLFSPED